MTPGTVATALEVVSRQFAPILEPSSLRGLEQAKAEVAASFEIFMREKRRGRRPAWGFAIRPSESLEFTRSRVHGVELSADIACEFRWEDAEGIPAVQKLLMRVWGYDDAVVYREDLDAPGVLERLTSTDARRVMLRYHFDRANEGQTGPSYHLQAGGNSDPAELCWLHEAVAVPRLATPPIDLVLACEVVAANFHAVKFDEISRDPTVIGAIRNSEQAILRTYYDDCSAALGRDGGLLRALWNIKKSWAT